MSDSLEDVHNAKPKAGSSNSHFEVNLNKKPEDEKVKGCINCKNLQLGLGILFAISGLITVIVYAGIEIIIDEFLALKTMQHVLIYGAMAILSYFVFRGFRYYCNFTWNDGTRDTFSLAFTLGGCFLLFILINIAVYFEPIILTEIDLVYADQDNIKQLVLDLDCKTFNSGYYKAGGYYGIVGSGASLELESSIRVDGTSIDKKYEECQN